jgi:hypothetical protein
VADERINVVLGAEIDPLAEGMRRGSRIVSDETKHINGALHEMSSAVESSLKAWLGFEGLKNLVEFAAQAGEFGDEMIKASERVGVTVEEMSRLEFAAKMSDVSLQDLTGSLAKLSRNLAEASTNGEAGAAKALRAMGLSATDAHGKLVSLDLILGQIATKFQGYEDGAGKAALAMELFGRSGAELIPFLNQGASGIDALKRKADELGVTLGGEAARKLQEYDDKIKEFKATIGADWRGIMVDSGLLDVLATIGDFASNGVGGVKDITDKVKELYEYLQRIGALPGFDPTAALNNDPSLVASLGRGGKKAPPVVGGAFKLTDEERERLERLREILKDQQNLYDEQTEAALREFNEMLREQDAALKEHAGQWKDTFDAIPKAFQNAARDWKRTGTDMRDFWRDLMLDLVKQAAAAEWSIVTTHAAAWLAKKNITLNGVITEVALNTWKAIKVIALYAAEAAAALWKWMTANFGIYGAIAGAGAAAGLFAGIISYAHAGSSVGGNAPSSGGGGGGSSGGGGARSGASNVIVVKALDAADVHQWATRNANVIARAALAGANNGVAGMTDPGRR